MGYSLNGIWQDTESLKRSTDGSFVREVSRFRNLKLELAPGAGLYHLYVSRACPWAHRVLITRALLGLESFLPTSYVAPVMGSRGWHFEGSFRDEVFGFDTLHSIYLTADKHYTGRVTVPILYSVSKGTIVNNESSELIRMLNEQAPRTKRFDLDLYPDKHREEIDYWNAKIYENLNNGVYRCGFAASQQAYEMSVAALFECLDELEVHLENRDVMVGDRLTETDVRLFPTLIRFDPVYHGHFKCNQKKLIEYPAIIRYVRRLFSEIDIQETCDLDEIKTHYYASHLTINPTGIIPKGPIEWP